MSSRKKEGIQVENVSDDEYKYLKGGMFLATVTGMAIMFGFGMTLAMAKKRDPSFFSKGLVSSREQPDSGGYLAMKALGHATVYSVSGFGLLCFAVWKLMGVTNFQEFRTKMQSMMSKPKTEKSVGRNDFQSFRELVQYLIDENKKK